MFEQHGQEVGRFLQLLAQRRFLVAAGPLQHVVDDFAAAAGLLVVARMTDAEAQAPERRADVLDDAGDTLVTRAAAIEPELRAAGRQVELVVGDEHALGRDLVIAHCRPDGLAAQVHVRRRFQQANSLAADRDLRGLALQLALTRERAAVLFRQEIDEPESHVVSRGRVLRPRIAEADDQVEWRSHATQLLERKGRLAAAFRTNANSSRLLLPFALAALRVGSLGAAAFGVGLRGVAARGRFAFLPRLGLRQRGHLAGRRLGLGRNVDFLGARQVDRDDRIVLATGERDERDTFGQLDVREVIDLIQLERRDVERQELRQEARQAAHFDVGQQMIDDAALVLDALGLELAGEVNRDVQGDLDVLADALEVEMHDQRPRRVALDALDDDLLRLRADLERQDARVEGFAAHLILERVVLENERLGRFAAAIHDGGDFAGLAQAAAIGAAELRAWLSGQFECGFHR